MNYNWNCCVKRTKAKVSAKNGFPKSVNYKLLLGLRVLFFFCSDRPCFSRQDVLARVAPRMLVTVT